MNLFSQGSKVTEQPKPCTFACPTTSVSNVILCFLPVPALVSPPFLSIRPLACILNTLRGVIIPFHWLSELVPVHDDEADLALNRKPEFMGCVTTTNQGNKRLNFRTTSFWAKGIRKDKK